MNEGQKKILKIIDAMYSYCVFVGATDVAIRTRKEGNFYIVLIDSDFSERYLKKYISKLERILNQPKDPTIEQMYWNMIGSSKFQDDNDIYVVGSMVDTAEVKIEGNHLNIVLTKKYEGK
ncbi:hypothetical protein GX831_04735 [bacterium]|jgi:hypothetical protein|nr:hypothetical protein [bacterium]